LDVIFTNTSTLDKISTSCHVYSCTIYTAMPSDTNVSPDRGAQTRGWEVFPFPFITLKYVSNWLTFTGANRIDPEQQ